jgi:4-diphosphocytidyl-2-C-methyl-D-erythritol kinase
LTASQTARAKINLALHVTARRDDGYHELDSLVAFADCADELRLEQSRQTELTVGGPFADALSATGDGPNIVLKAVDALRARWPDRYEPVSINLEKNLPVASGIGGGSSDAAATLRALQALFGPVDDVGELGRIALELGADVPVCLVSATCRMRGIGEDLHPVENMPSFDAVLVNPGVAVSTPSIFRSIGLSPGETAFDAMPELPADASMADWIGWLQGCRNDLQHAAQEVEPLITEVLAMIARSPGCRLHRMSGSGATCFGLFDDPEHAHAAAEQLRRQKPHWWVMPSRLG